MDAVLGEHGGRDWRPAPALLTACRTIGSGSPADYRCAGTMRNGNFLTLLYSTPPGVSGGAPAPLLWAVAAAMPPIGVPGPRTKPGYASAPISGMSRPSISVSAETR